MIHKAFECYKELKNEVIEDKELKVDKSIIGGLDEIIRVYEVFLKNDANYLKEIKEIGYTKRDIEDFCYELKDYQDREYFFYTGLYISKLINNIIKSNDKIFLDLTELNRKIFYIGHGLKRGKVIVKASNQNLAFIGDRMTGGEIHIDCKQASLSDSIEGGKIYYRGTLILSEKRVNVFIQKIKEGFTPVKWPEHF